MLVKLNTLRRLSKWLLIPLALILVAASLYLRMKFFGWLMLFGIFIYPLLGLIHVIVQILAIRRSPNLSIRALGYIVASDFLYVIAMLFQFDAGDSTGWLTITRIADKMPIEVSSWLVSNGPSISWVVFIPLCVTWFLIALELYNQLSLRKAAIPVILGCVALSVWYTVLSHSRDNLVTTDNYGHPKGSPTRQPSRTPGLTPSTTPTLAPPPLS
jgi:hypothetical protein